MEFSEPSLEVLFTEFVHVGMTVDLNVGSCLDNVDTIEHVEKALSLDGHGELLIEHIKEDIGSTLVWGCNGKVVDLSFKENLLAIKNAGI